MRILKESIENWNYEWNPDDSINGTHLWTYDSKHGSATIRGEAGDQYCYVYINTQGEYPRRFRFGPKGIEKAKQWSVEVIETIYNSSKNDPEFDSDSLTHFYYGE